MKDKVTILDFFEALGIALLVVGISLLVSAGIVELINWISNVSIS